MKLNELLKTTPETLAVEQHKALKDHVIAKLSVAMTAIETENYKHIGNLTFSSPAGDGYGQDNNCLNFGVDETDELDIQEVTDRLMALKSIFVKSKK